MENSKELRIGLYENGTHSLIKGFELWKDWKQTTNPWLLKESIFWVHHGIELMLKYLLAQTSEFLVFKDVDDGVKKLKKLRTKNTHAEVIDLFEQPEESSALSVGFKDLVDRCAIILRIPELEENSGLRKDINILTSYRNKITHFSVIIDPIEISDIFSEIYVDIMKILKYLVKDEDFKEKSKIIDKAANIVININIEYHKRNEDRIYNMISKINNYSFDGNLFSSDKKVFIGKFVNGIERNQKIDNYTFDISGVDVKNTHWLIEIKMRFSWHISKYINNIIELAKKNKYSIWIIFMNSVPDEFRSKMLKEGIYVSSIRDIRSIESFIFSKSKPQV